MLFVLEGLDGAGKSTQVRKLADYLRSRLGSLEYIHFPRYDAPVYGQLISNFLKGEYGSNDSVHPQLVALLFAEDRHGAKDGIKAILDKGGAVLLDRYVYSNVAYQCAKMPEGDKAEYLREWILNTEYGQFDLPRPDLNIFPGRANLVRGVQPRRKPQRGGPQLPPGQAGHPRVGHRVPETGAQDIPPPGRPGQGFPGDRLLGRQRADVASG